MSAPAVSTLKYLFQGSRVVGNRRAHRQSGPRSWRCNEFQSLQARLTPPTSSEAMNLVVSAEVEVMGHIGFVEALLHLALKVLIVSRESPTPVAGMSKRFYGSIAWYRPTHPRVGAQGSARIQQRFRRLASFSSCLPGFFIGGGDDRPT